MLAPTRGVAPGLSTQVLHEQRCATLPPWRSAALDRATGIGFFAAAVKTADRFFWFFPVIREEPFFLLDSCRPRRVPVQSGILDGAFLCVLRQEAGGMPNCAMNQRVNELAME